MYTSEAEIAEVNSITTSFGEKVCLVADTFTLVTNCYCKQTFDVEKLCKVMRWLPSWPEYCWMPVASNKATTWYPCWLFILSPRTEQSMSVCGPTTTFKGND